MKIRSYTIILLSGFIFMLGACSLTSKLEGIWNEDSVQNPGSLVFKGLTFQLIYFDGAVKKTAKGTYTVKESSSSYGKTNMLIEFNVTESDKPESSNQNDTKFLAIGSQILTCTLKERETELDISPGDSSKGLALWGSYER